MTRWLLIFLFLLPGMLQAAKSVHIDQAWRDTSDGVLDIDDGDAVFFDGDIYADKWGIICNNMNVNIYMQGHSLFYNTITCPTVLDGDMESVGDWTFTDADSAYQQAGQWHYPATLWEGSYALRVGIPCDDQTIITKTSYTLDADVYYRVSAQGYISPGHVGVSYPSATTRLSIGLVDDYGDTLIRWTYPEASYEQGTRCIYVTYKPEQDTSVYIFLKVTGADDADSGVVWFDNVKVTTAYYHGVAFGPIIGSGTGYKAHGLCFMSTSYTSNVCADDRWCEHYPAQGEAAGSRIQGGTIEDVNGTFGGAGVFCMWGNEFEMDSLTITSGGDACYNFFTWNADKDSITNCTMTLSGESVMKRQSTSHMNINVSGANAAGNGVWVGHNTLKGSDHVGIDCRTYNNLTATRVYNNYIRINSRHSNGFAITDGGEDACWIYDNNILTDSTNCKGQGIHITGKESTGYGRVSGNTIVVSNIADNSQEYAETPDVYGIQLEGGYVCSLWSNTITATSKSDGPSAMALRINYSSTDDYWIHSNTFKGFVEADNRTGASLQFGSTGGWDYEYDGWDIDSNTFVTNDIWLNNLGGCRGFTLRHPTFQIDTTTYSFTDWRPMRAVATPAVESLLIINASFPNDSTKQLFLGPDAGFIHDDTSGTDAHTSADWYYGWEVTIDVNDGDGDPVVSAPYRVVNTDGDTVYSGTVDASGEVEHDVYEFLDLPTDPTYDQSTMRTDYNDHIFIAWNTDWSLSDTSTVTIDAAQTVTLTIAPAMTEVSEHIGGTTLGGTVIK